MISIVTPWLNHVELRPAYETAVRGARVVIVNQASDEETTEALCDMVDRLGNGSTIIHNLDNLHYAAGNNQGLALVDTDVVCFLNNDVFSPDGTAGWLEQVARDVKPGGLYGPTVPGFEVDRDVLPYVEGWCLAGHTDLFRRIGGWDAVNFPRAYAEDVELSYRARKHGAELYQTRWNIRHIGNATNATLPGGYDAADGQRERFREMVRADRGRA